MSNCMGVKVHIVHVSHSRLRRVYVCVRPLRLERVCAASSYLFPVWKWLSRSLWSRLHVQCCGAHTQKASRMNVTVCLCGEYHLHALFAFRLVYSFHGLPQVIKSVEIACSGICACLCLCLSLVHRIGIAFLSYVNVTTVLRFSTRLFSFYQTRQDYYEHRNRKHLINFIFLLYLFFPFPIVNHTSPSVTRYTTILLILFVIYGSIKASKLWGMRSARTLVLIMRNKRCFRALIK